MKKDNVFRYKIDSKKLRGLYWFRILLLLLLSPFLLAIVSAIFPFIGDAIEKIATFVISHLPQYGVEKIGKGLFIVSIVYLSFGIVPFVWFLSRYKFSLANKTLELMCDEHKWSYVFSVSEYENPKSQASWIKDRLISFRVFGKAKSGSFCKVLFGNSFDREFALDRVFLYFNDIENLSTSGVGRTSVPETPKSLFEGFLLRTKPKKKIQNIILIKPRKKFFNKIKELQKIEIDTQKVFDVYTDNPKSLQKDLSEEFLSALIAYSKEIDKKITILIAPSGILGIKKETSWTGLFSPVIFRSIETQVIKQWQKYENFINLLELFNLLEKGK